jgi:hypothetical protein
MSLFPFPFSILRQALGKSPATIAQLIHAEREER